MARRPRYEAPGALHHVYSRGNDKQTIFFDDQDRERFLGLLEREVQDRLWRLLAFALMGNHFHLVLETTEPNLGRGMQRFLSAYVHQVNPKVPRINHMFGSRFGSARLWTPERVVQALAYVALNPVEADLCERPEDWRWSSYGGVIRAEASSLIATDSLTAYVTPEEYRAAVEAALAPA